MDTPDTEKNFYQSKEVLNVQRNGHAHVKLGPSSNSLTKKKLGFKGGLEEAES